MSNFYFLERRDPALAELGRRAEQYVFDDPNTSLVKLRQFLERFVEFVAGQHKTGFSADETLNHRLGLLARRGWLDPTAASYAHSLRHAGNRAVHELATSASAAVKGLRDARRLAIWLEANYGDPDRKPGRFHLPEPPPDASAQLQAALAEQARLEAELDAALAASDATRAALDAQLAEQARLLARPHVVLDQSVAAALDALPEDERAPARAALERFRAAADPDDLEPFSDPVDPGLRWTPLTEHHVLVVAVAPDASVLLVLWVGGVEGAVAWAAPRSVRVHPVTANLQVVRADAPAAPPAADGLFAPLSDDDLLSCGVPPLLLPAVRALDAIEALHALAHYLPPEAAETLLGVADGVPVADARADAGLGLPHPDVPVDEGDFAAALAHPATRRTFVEVPDDAALAAVLDAPFATWRTFLHPSQERVVHMRAKGPVRVLGGAGTGKTVALLHRAVLLARERFTAPDDRLLITTFTRTLADELAHLLRDFAPDVAPRIEVLALHRFARRVLVGNDQRVYEPISDAQRRRIVAAAAAEHDPDRTFTLEWLLAEWRDLLWRFGLHTRDDYFRSGRTGRGVRIGRRQKALAWRILDAARQRMEDEGVAEADRLCRDAAALLRARPELAAHRAVLADEVQDFGADALHLLRAAAPEGPDDLFLVGDGHQRLYGAPVTLSSCAIHVRGRASRLRLNYRTTESIRRLAHAALGAHVADDLDGGDDTLQGYRSLRDGAPPTWEWRPDQASSHAALAELVDGWAQEEDPSHLCVAARTRKELEALSARLQQRGLDVSPLDQPPRPGVRLSTFHRLKGTEFARVALASVCAGGLPRDDASERCLLYVASTRARDQLVLAGWGDPSPLLAPESA